ncbi:MerC domain-containing protein [Sphingomonas sp. ABOLD]|uniref:MerC mercury resistance protein n=2 Tax=Sphingomonas TaxID=13687 RepID=A0A7X5XXP6_9SPHN|nr:MULTISPECIES: MerC domain-containing protein [Sphingomonas]NJB97254.1 hypothetical protein [Sphingomonas trueperi]RSV40424.1 MerC domain-containing protein [Sphingomonas sp. ABOLE]RSV49306.1 MerC domain-containing protein [Sphingomonas sp. ABOLD]
MVQDERRAAAGWQGRLDGLGICASALCLLHCLVLPLLLAALPALAARLGPHDSLHWLVLAIALPTGAIALGGGWRRHRAAAPLILGVIGLASLAAGVALPMRELFETGLTVAGSLLLAGAHLANWRRRAGPLAWRRRCDLAC